VSLSLKSRFWRFVLCNTLKKQRLSIPEHRASGKNNARWLGGLPENMRATPVEIAGLRAEWIGPVDASENAGGSPAVQRVILHLHGGGYVTGAIETYRMLCGLLANCAGAKVLIPEYRLAPESPFPAALDDALAVYRWLLAGGYQPANIIFSGDSAGGGLCLATVLALRDQHEALPAALVCLSPWTDLTLKGQSHITRAKTEAILNTDVLREWALSYTNAANLTNPLVSPAYADFHGFPPLFIQVGSEEILLDDAIQLAEKARAAGVDVQLKIWDGLWHVWQALGNLIPENRQTFVEIGQFAREHFQKA
jgi:acetyl esterase/lipase